MDIRKEDIQDYINYSYEEYNKKDIIDCLCSIYSIKNDSEKYVIQKLVGHTVDENIKKQEIYEKRKKQLNLLKQLDLPEQRTKEWYEMRKEKLTASSLAAALGKCHFTSRNELLLSKIEEKPYQSNEITEWGVKYEDIAIAFYEEMFNVKVLDFGLIPHPEFNAFGASPDGICDDTGNNDYVSRMVEIKCPPKRKFTKTVPPHYGMQVQGQLEVCDLDECDFFQVKIEEYKDFNEYKKDNFINDDKIIQGRTNINFPKGVTISYRKKNELKLSYLYPKLNLTDDNYKQWIDDQKIKILLNGDDFIESKWWKISRYECTLVKRDNNWWINNIDKILQFYNDLLYYRDNIDALKDKIKEEDKAKKDYRKKLKDLNEFILVSDEEDN